MEKKEYLLGLERKSIEMFKTAGHIFKMVHDKPLLEADVLFRDSILKLPVHAAVRHETVMNRPIIRANINSVGRDIIIPDMLNFLYYINRIDADDSRQDGTIPVERPLIVDNFGLRLVRKFLHPLGSVSEIDYMTGDVRASTWMLKYREAEHNRFYLVKSGVIDIIKIAN